MVLIRAAGKSNQKWGHSMAAIPIFLSPEIFLAPQLKPVDGLSMVVNKMVLEILNQLLILALGTSERLTAVRSTLTQ